MSITNIISNRRNGKEYDFKKLLIIKTQKAILLNGTFCILTNNNIIKYKNFIKDTLINTNTEFKEEGNKLIFDGGDI